MANIVRKINARLIINRTSLRYASTAEDSSNTANTKKGKLTEKEEEESDLGLRSKLGSSSFGGLQEEKWFYEQQQAQLEELRKKHGAEKAPKDKK